MTVKCPVCNGHMRVDADDFGMESEQDDNSVPCPHCQGDGETEIMYSIKDEIVEIYDYDGNKLRDIHLDTLIKKGLEWHEWGKF